MEHAAKDQGPVRKYLASELDAPKWGNGEYAPQQVFLSDLSGNTVDYFINGTAYFSALDAEIQTLLNSNARGRYFFMSAWWLGLSNMPADTQVSPLGDLTATILKPFQVTLAQPWQVGTNFPALTLPSGVLLSRRLEDLQKSGADVRILAWVSPFAARYRIQQLAGIGLLNVQTLLSVAEMRSRFGPNGQGNVMVNLAAHPAGASHCKIVVAGDQTSTRAFTGGIDPVQSRMHPAWHDLAVRVTGPAATAIYRFFQQLWSENLQRPAETFRVGGAGILSRLDSASKISDPPPPPQGTGNGDYVQVLRTVPQMNFSVTGPDWLYPENSAVRALITAGAGFRKDPIKFAADGRFEFKVALRKAISQAEKYIFIADQAFTSEEIMDWINARILQKPDLKVILLHGSDPADPPSGDLAQAVNAHLIPHVKPYLLGSPSGLQGIQFYGWGGTTVHCKVTIIDDIFCIVGSANAMRRSLYTDVELSVAILDVTGSGTVRRLRRDLWAKYCGMTLPWEMLLIGSKDPGYDELLDLDNALSLWAPMWAGTLPPGVKVLPAIKGFGLPMAVTTPYSGKDHDQQDADSRKIF
jgi:phosphatidylserine/phosphatidylglycerophosphate/cardiolipin synthase-like enzyme